MADVTLESLLADGTVADEAAIDTKVAVHTDDAVDAHNASAVSFAPTVEGFGLDETDVQAAIEELMTKAIASDISFFGDAEASAGAFVSNHAGAADPHPGYVQESAIGSAVQAFDADIPTVAASQAEMEAGTEAALRSMSPLRVAQAIAGLAAAGGIPDPIFDLFGTPDTAFEFDTSSLTGLTTLGSPDTMDADTRFAGHLYIADNDASQVGAYASVSPPFTAIIKLTACDASVPYQYVGAFCGEATPGKMVWIGLIQIGVPMAWVMRTMATPSDGSPGTPTMVTPPYYGGDHYPAYFAIRAASSTDVSYYMSGEGRIWYPMLLNHDNSMTVASVGMSLSQYSAGAKAAQGAYDYLRIWNSALTIPAFT